MSKIYYSLSYSYLGHNHAESFGTTVTIIWGDVNKKYNVAMESVSFAVGYNLCPVFSLYIYLHFSKLAALKLCRISY